MNSSVTELWLVRHGETEWSKSMRHTGRTDIQLTERGRRQARSLKPVLAAQNFDRVLCSPLQRAHETAQLAGYTDETGMRLDDELMEWNYGDFEGHTGEELTRKLGTFDIWSTPIPHGESLTDVAQRSQRVLARLETGRTLIFAHGHLLRILTARWLDLSPEHGRLFALNAGSLCVLGSEHGHRVMHRWNLDFPMTEDR